MAAHTLTLSLSQETLAAAIVAVAAPTTYSSVDDMLTKALGTALGELQATYQPQLTNLSNWCGQATTDPVKQNKIAQVLAGAL